MSNKKIKPEDVDWEFLSSEEMGEAILHLLNNCNCMCKHIREFRRYVLEEEE